MHKLLQKQFRYKHLFSYKKMYLNFFLSVLGAVSIFSGVFFLTQEPRPHVSELAFTEYSQHGEGSVIPASCVSGIWNGDGNFSGCTLCWNGNWTEISGCPVQPVVNGSPSPYHYTCLTGTTANPVDGVNTWTWDCLGSNGGTNASGIENKPLNASTTAATACVVPNSGNTCPNHLFSWNTVSAVGPVKLIGDGGGPTSTTAFNQTNEPLDVRYIDGTSPHVFQLYDNGTPKAVISVVADCASNSAWNGTSCQLCGNGLCTNHICNNGATDAPTCTPAPTIGTFVATPSTLTVGDFSTLSWSGVVDAISCRIYGGRFIPAPQAGTNASGSTTTDPLTASTTYWFTCGSAGGLTTQKIVTAAIVNPQVSSFGLTGNNTTSGTFSLTCTGSTHYDILKNGVSVYGGNQTYLGSTVTRNVVSGDDGNYVGVCINGTVERYSSGIYYNSDPLKPIISITASPRTITKNTNTVLSWTIQNPSVAPASLCSVDVKAVCTAGGCSTEQTTTESTVRSILTTGTIDAGGTTITNSVRGTPLIGGKAVGSKTVKLGNSVDFTVTCGHVTGAVKSSTRVMVTQTNEQ